MRCQVLDSVDFCPEFSNNEITSDRYFLLFLSGPSPIIGHYVGHQFFFVFPLRKWKMDATWLKKDTHKFSAL